MKVGEEENRRNEGQAGRQATGFDLVLGADGCLSVDRGAAGSRLKRLDRRR